MIKKAWCKTAQIVLDRLNEGCSLRVCIHNRRYTSDRHGYVWDPKRGEAIRQVQDTILRRLVDDGFVVEIQRCQCRKSCIDRFGGVVSPIWEATYRVTGEDEDSHIYAQRNKEREALYEALLAVREHQQALSKLPMRSQAASDVLQLLGEVGTNATAALAPSPRSESEAPQVSGQ